MTEEKTYFTEGRGRRFFRKSSMVITLAVCCGILASCTSKATQRRKSMGGAFEDGDYIAMIEDIRKNSKNLYGETNAYLFHMDIGVLFHYAGMYDSSNTHLMKAADIYDELFAKSVTNEAAALLTNDNVRPYRSKPYELVILHQFTALNFMAEGKFQEALVETRKVQLLMNEWERTEAQNGKYHTDGMFHLFSSLTYERLDEPDNSLISLFKSVQAYNLGPVKLPPEVGGFAYDRLTAGDREDDVKTLKVTPDNGPNKWSAKQGESEIVVVGYAGRGPAMKEQNWYGEYIQGGRLRIYVRGTNLAVEMPAPPLPAGKSASQMVNVKISLPELKTYPALSSYFTVRLDDGDEVQSVVINDLDKQAKKALDDAWGEIILRTVVRAVVRTIAANEVKNRVNTGSALGNALIGIGADVATDQMEKADIRMCFMLPKTIQMARIPVAPGTHSVTLAVRDDYGKIIGRKVYNDIEVRNGEKKVLFHNALK